MGRILGHYEWDDDELTPGRKQEGGLHQNLFDSGGKLRANARFVPMEEVDPDHTLATEYVTERVYVTAEERRLTPEQQELADLISRVLSIFIAKGIEKAEPHVKQWWKESVRPFLAEQRDRLRVAARVFSEEQLKMVHGAEIIDAENVIEIEYKLAQLPSREVCELVSRMVTDPSMFREENLAELASVLGRVNPPSRESVGQSDGNG